MAALGAVDSLAGMSCQLQAETRSKAPESPPSLRVQDGLQCFTLSASKGGANSPLIGTLQETNNLTEKCRLV